MKAAEIDLSAMLEFEPDSGRLTLGKDRMLVFRQDAMAELRCLLIEHAGEWLARATLAKFGYRCGQGDFENLSQNYHWDSEQDQFAAGPVMHSWEGIVHVRPTLLDFDRDTGRFHMTGIWRNSYEAEIHVKQFGVSATPVCHSLTGYASGWCSAFFGRPLLAIETRCAGRGDDRCEFEIRPGEAWGEEADPWKHALEATEATLSRELEQKVARQARAISELSTPVVEVWDDVLVLPIVGAIDTQRSLDVMDNLLRRIVETQSRCVIIDITGVDMIDTNTADSLIKVIRAAVVLGTRCVLTGSNPTVARTLVEIGANMGEVRTLPDLKQGLKDCLRYLGSGTAGSAAAG